MALTTQQHILHELQAAEPLTLLQLQSALAAQEIVISPTDLELQVDELIEKSWIEYYGLVDTDELGYELCNRWYNLPETEREHLLIGE